MAMQILGIDPGITGGVAVVSAWRPYRAPIIEDGMRMPVTSHRSKKLVDAKKLFEWLSNFDIDVAVVEWVHAMPKQGVSSSFSFGRSTGSVEAIALLVSDRMEWVSPQVWKQHLGLSSSKQASIDEARHKFGVTYRWDKKADNGIAEAALLAQWYLDKRV